MAATCVFNLYRKSKLRKTLSKVNYHIKVMILSYYAGDGATVSSTSEVHWWKEINDRVTRCSNEVSLNFLNWMKHWGRGRGRRQTVTWTHIGRYHNPILPYKTRRVGEIHTRCPNKAFRTNFMCWLPLSDVVWSVKFLAQTHFSEDGFRYWYG